MGPSEREMGGEVRKVTPLKGTEKQWSERKRFIMWKESFASGKLNMPIKTAKVQFSMIVREKVSNSSSFSLSCYRHQYTSSEVPVRQ